MEFIMAAASSIVLLFEKLQAWKLIHLNVDNLV